MCLYGILKFCAILCRHLAHTGCLVLMFLDQFSESINVKCILSCLWPLLSNDISMKELPLCVKILICVIGVSASLSFFLCHVLIFLMMFCICIFLNSFSIYLFFLSCACVWMDWYQNSKIFSTSFIWYRREVCPGCVLLACGLVPADLPGWEGLASPCCSGKNDFTGQQ